MSDDKPAHSSDDPLVYPEQLAAKPNAGPTPERAKLAGDLQPAPDVPEFGRENRGQPANTTAAGEVTGSGASAGGGGGPEDIDSDSASGGDPNEMPVADH